MEVLLPKFDPNDDEAGLKLWDVLTSKAGEIQQQVLREILKQNSKTEYLSRFLHENDESSSHDAFLKNVPVVGYDDVKSYIERVCNGEPSEIISSKPIIELLTSSGTSGGKPKMMPSTAEELHRKTFFFNLLVPIMNKYVDGLDKGKGMFILFVKPEITTPCGLMARPVLTSYYKSDNFRKRPFNKYNIYTSPDEVILCSDSQQSMFAQLLCGLVQRDEVLRVGAIFASAFLRVIKFLETHWEEMCDNIRTGYMSNWIVDEGCRKAVSLVLGEPNSELARLIESICRKESWEGIINKIWPKTKCIEVIVTGSMAQYIPTLEFYSGGLPLVSTMYASSECFFGININPLCKPSEVSYTLVPNMAYFEFLPVTKNGDELIPQVACNSDCSSHTNHDHTVKPVALVDVKPGQYYELVVTTFTGLYRYKVGDILMVTGFYKNAPQVRFIHRKNVVLSIDIDKTNEDDLLNAVTQAKLVIEPQGLLLTEYTSYADTSSIPGHYVLFWELALRGNNNFNNELDLVLQKLDADTMLKCCHAVEEALDSVYRRCRYKDKSIGALEIRVVTPGTFDVLMDHCVSLGSSVNQYKASRCVTSEEAIRLLNSRVIERFVSKHEPFWEPIQIVNTQNLSSNSHAITEL